MKHNIYEIKNMNIIKYNTEFDYKYETQLTMK